MKIVQICLEIYVFASVLIIFQSIINLVTEFFICFGIILFLIFADSKTTITLISIIIPISLLYMKLLKKKYHLKLVKEFS